MIKHSRQIEVYVYIPLQNIMFLQVVEELNNYINDYNKVLMHQTNKPMDPASLPEHFNGTWMPWINLRSDYDSLLHFL